mgnify:CR=1 FL=1
MLNEACGVSIAIGGRSVLDGTDHLLFDQDHDSPRWSEQKIVEILCYTMIITYGTDIFIFDDEDFLIIEKKRIRQSLIILKECLSRCYINR